MPEIVTKELKVRAYVDAQTGQLKVFEADMDKVGKAVDKAQIAMKRQEAQLQRQQQAMDRTRGGVLRATAAFSSLYGPVGQVGGQVIGLSDQLGNLQNNLQSTGSSVNVFTSSLSQSTAAIGKLGVAGLVAGAAIAGWKIGTWISNVTGLGKALDQTTQSVIDFANAAEDAAKQDALFQATGKLGAALMEKYGLSVAEFQKRLAAAGGDVTKLAGQLKTQSAIAASAGEQWARDFAGKIQESNREAFDAMRSNAENFRIYNDKFNALMANGAENLSKKQQQEAEKYYTLAEQYRKADLADQQKADQERANAAKALADKRIAEEKRASEAIVKEMQQLQQQALGTLLNEDFGQAILSNLIGSGADYVDQQMKPVFDEYLVVLNNALEKQDAYAEAAAKATVEQNKLNDALKEAAIDAEIARAKLLTYADILRQVGGIAGNTGATFLEAFQWAKDQGATGVQAGIFGIGQAFVELGNSIGGSTGKILSSLGTLASAFAQGGLVGAIVAGAGMLFNALIKLFSHDWAGDVQDLLNMWNGFSGISEQLQKQIADQAKELDDAGSAMFLNLSQVASELGVTQQNWQSYFQAVMYGFDAVNKGFLTQQQLAQGLNDILPQLAQAAIEWGGVYLDQLEAILKKAQEAGVSVQSIYEMIANKVKELQQQVLAQLDVLSENLTPLLADLNKQIDDAFSGATAGGAGGLGANVDKQLQQFMQSAQGYAAILSQTFNALLQAGVPVADAVAKISPNLEQLREILKKVGLTMNDVGLAWVNQIDQINKKYPEQVAVINAVTAELQAQLKLGIDPGVKGFQAMQQSALDAFAKINADGKVTKGELATVKPLLIALAQASLQYGYALDPATIALLKQAGLWDDIANKPDASKVQQKGIGDLIELMTKDPGGLIPELMRFIQLLTDLNGTVVQTTVQTNYTNSGQPPKQNGPPVGRRSFQGITEPYTFQYPEVIQVHPMETIYPDPRNLSRRELRKRETAPRQQIIRNYNFYGYDDRKIRETIRRLEREGEL